ncbi:MAG: threonine synthase [Chloroflexi bacterium]|nr:threonine synthase [Chloroflexota bacterium]
MSESRLTHLECSICGERHDASVLQTICTACGRALVARYDLPAAAQTFSREALAGRPWNMWRYAEVMPGDVSSPTTLGEGMTPLLPARRLGAQAGVADLWVKDEGGNPTGSFKARGLSAAISRARELGVTDLGVPTAGNAGSAAASYASRAGIRAHVAMPDDTPATIMAEVRAYGAELTLVKGTISDAGAYIAQRAAEEGWFVLATLKEPYRVEGKKTMGYELWEQFGDLGDGLPDVVVYPTGGGTGLIGMWKAFDELEAMGLIGSERPRMIAVQAEGCAPIVRAFDLGLDRAEPWEDAQTLAPGIRVPAPFADDLIMQSLYASKGAAVAITDQSILAAMEEFARLEGIDACPEGAATLAGLHRMVERGLVRADERVVLFNTGTGLKHPELRGQTGIA